MNEKISKFLLTAIKMLSFEKKEIMPMLNKKLLDDDLEVLLLLGHTDESDIEKNIKQETFKIVTAMLIFYILTLFVMDGFSNWLIIGLLVIPIFVQPTKAYLYSRYISEAQNRMKNIIPEYTTEYEECLKKSLANPLLKEKFNDKKRKVDLIKGLFSQCKSEYDAKKESRKKEIDKIIDAQSRQE